MKIVAFTSCSINYLAKARTMASSLRSFVPQAEIHLCLNDVIPPWFNLDDEPFDSCLHPTDYGLDNADAWIFKHDIMELNTAVKGPALLQLMASRHGDLYFYFDPDCLFFSNPSVIDEYLGEKSVGLTPHILGPERSESGIFDTELSVLKHGVYNLGFLAVRADDNGRQFAEWWSDRLLKFCYMDFERGLFTDQRWIDLVPAIFPFTKILRNSNLNFASWNFDGRRLEYDPANRERFLVDDEPLVFYHFSGVGPRGVHTHMKEKYQSGSAVLAEIQIYYESLLAENGQASLEDHAFAYNFFDNGEQITRTQRVTYRDSPDLENSFPNPFLVDPTTRSYYQWCTENLAELDGKALRKLGLPLDEAVSRLIVDDFYVASYPDARTEIESGQFSSAEAHYREVGSLCGYNPNLFFDTAFYWHQVRDLDIFLIDGISSHQTALSHFLKIGLQQRLKPSEYFDNEWYVRTYRDVGTAVQSGHFSCGFEHYVLYGHKELRSPGPEFIENEYLEDNPDVRSEIGRSIPCGYAHYLLSGRLEGRGRS